MLLPMFYIKCNGLSWISKTGYTLIGLRDKNNDIDNVAPSTYIYSGVNTTTDTGNYAKLDITLATNTGGFFMAA